MDLIVIGSAFLLGLGSSLHCLGMCGPLVMAIPFPRNRQTTLTKVLYFSGKALTYGFMGLLVGGLGIRYIWGDIQQYLSVLAGVIIILIALFPLLIPAKASSRWVFQSFQKVFKRIQTNPRWWHFLQLGMLNGVLPCGMVYMALTLSFASGNALNGFVAMIAFSLGTTPILWAVTLIKDKITPVIRRKLRPITIAIAIIVGVLLILRGMNLGIPFISPQMDNILHGTHHH